MRDTCQCVCVCVFASGWYKVVRHCCCQAWAAAACCATGPTLRPASVVSQPITRCAGESGLLWSRPPHALRLSHSAVIEPLTGSAVNQLMHDLCPLTPCKWPTPARSALQANVAFSDLCLCDACCRHLHRTMSFFFSRCCCMSLCVSVCVSVPVVTATGSCHYLTRSASPPSVPNQHRHVRARTCMAASVRCGCFLCLIVGFCGGHSMPLFWRGVTGVWELTTTRHLPTHFWDTFLFSSFFPPSGRYAGPGGILCSGDIRTGGCGTTWTNLWTS